MKDKNLESVLIGTKHAKKNIIKIGWIKLDLNRIPALNTIVATKEYNKWVNFKKENKNDVTEQDLLEKYIDTVIEILDWPFALNMIGPWFKTRFLTKKYMLKHTNIKQLDEIVQEVLDPILGIKKKEQETIEKTSINYQEMTKAFLEIINKVNKEVGAKESAELLRMLLQPQAGAKEKS